MILSKFFLNVLIRVTFIVLSGILLGIILQHLDRGYYYTLAGIVFLILLQAWLLIKEVNRINDDLEKFFSSVHDQDSSVRFPGKTKNGSFRKLHESMNHLNTVIQDGKIENERTGQFLQSVVDHVDTGLLSFDEDGRINIYNRAVIKYLKVSQPSRLSALKVADSEILNVINTIKPGQEVLHKMKTDNFLQSILIRATGLKFENHVIKLVSFQDITNELEKKELDSWQRLIRVLTHEIMNSISPVTSLTSVIAGYFKKPGGETPVSPEKIDQQIIAKTLFGLNTIEETGKGLLDFVDRYRSLTNLPKPEFCKFSAGDLFRKCKLLMEAGISGNIKITLAVSPEDLVMFADYSQVEQVLINLVKNAIAAISGRKNGVIQLKAFRSEEDVIIQVTDNGMGISNEIIEDIFVPFYTTRENGSGIGLSLSKQIMQNHNGTISVNSTPGEGAVFTLKFQG